MRNATIVSVISIAAGLGLSATGAVAGTHSAPVLGAHGVQQRAPRVPSLIPPSELQRLRIAPIRAEGQRLRHAAKASTYVYTCEYAGSDCAIFSETGKRMGGLTAADGLANPQGTTADAQGNWYIANTGASNVLEFSPGGTALEQTLADPGEYPGDVAWGPTNTIAVSNISDTNSGPGSVSVYAYGATSPTAVLTDPAAAQGVGVTFDTAGNCYWSFNTASGGGQIDEFVGCGGSPLNSGIALGDAGGIAVNAQNNLAGLDRLTHDIIYCFFPGPPCDDYPTEMSAPAMLHFDATGTDVFASDIKSGVANELALPSLKQLRQYRMSPSDPPVGVTPGVGVDLLPPATIGQYHLAVLQAFFENYNAIMTLIGSPPPSNPGPAILQAMLQLPAIPDSTKAVASLILAAPPPPVPSAACASAISQFETGYPTTGGFGVDLKYLKSELAVQSPCSTFHPSVEAAVAIAEDGKTTIYNPKWLKSLKIGRPCCPPPINPDTEGAVIGGPGGAIEVIRTASLQSLAADTR